MVVRVLFRGADFSLSPHMVGGAQERCGVCLIRVTNPYKIILINKNSRGLYPRDLITFQMPHLLIPSHWGVGFQYMNGSGAH